MLKAHTAICSSWQGHTCCVCYVLSVWSQHGWKCLLSSLACRLNHGHRYKLKWVLQLIKCSEVWIALPASEAKQTTQHINRRLMEHNQSNSSTLELLLKFLPVQKFAFPKHNTSPRNCKGSLPSQWNSWKVYKRRSGHRGFCIGLLVKKQDLLLAWYKHLNVNLE